MASIAQVTDIIVRRTAIPSPLPCKWPVGFARMESFRSHAAGPSLPKSTANILR